MSKFCKVHLRASGTKALVPPSVPPLHTFSNFFLLVHFSSPSCATRFLTEALANLSQNISSLACGVTEIVVNEPIACKLCDGNAG